MLLPLVVLIGIFLQPSYAQAVPTVQVQQPSYSVTTGSSVTLVCTVTSTFTVNDVYWQRNIGGNIAQIRSTTNTNKYSGSNSGTPSLTIFNADQSDVGIYTCFATNSVGTGQSTTTQLSVTGTVPTVQVQPTTYSVTTGNSITLGCTVTSNLAVITVYWQRNINNVVTTITTTTNSNKYSGSTVSQPSLTIFNAAQSDAGVYTCIATNSVGTGQSTTTSLAVTGSIPVVTVSQPNYNVVIGNTVTLECTVSANPFQTSVSWQKIQNGVTSNVNTGLVVKYSGSTVNNPSLTITNTDTTDSANYVCTATNSVGTGTSSQISLSVTGSIPVVQIPQPSYTVNLAQTITITCTVTANPTHTSVQWQRTQNGVTTNIGVGSGKYSGGTVNSPSLSINNADLNDIGQYVCSATNIVGTGTSTATTLNVVGGVTCSFEEGFCGWSSGTWIRKNKSDFAASGPHIAADGRYFIQIDTNADAIMSTLNMDFSKPNVESCLKFKYHMKGTTLKDLTFGYYESSKYTNVNTVPRKNEDFWFCATFDLSLMSSQAQGIFFRAERGGVFSVIALDFITLIEGDGCKNLGECPVPKTTLAPATTKNPPTVATTGESASLSNAVPNVQVPQPSYSVTTGNSVTLVCTVTSTASVTSLYWQSNIGGSITQITPTTNTNKYSGITADTPSLTIFNADQSDVGTYTCFATNSVGTGQSSTTTLSVTWTSPTVQVQQPSYSVTNGDSVTLLCTVTSILTVSDVYWQRNIGGDITQIRSTTNNTKYVGSTTGTPSLTISKTDQSDVGTYTCFATNSVGTGQSTTTTLSVTERKEDDSQIVLYAGAVGLLVMAIFIGILLFIVKNKYCSRNKVPKQEGDDRHQQTEGSLELYNYAYIDEQQITNQNPFSVPPSLPVPRNVEQNQLNESSENNHRDEGYLNPYQPIQVANIYEHEYKAISVAITTDNQINEYLQLPE